LTAALHNHAVHTNSFIQYVSLTESRFYVHTGCTSVNTGVSTNLELVDKFYYLGDVLKIDRDADAALETRIQTGWNKFRQLVPLLTNKDISLIVRGRLYSTSVCGVVCCMEVRPGP